MIARMHARDTARLTTPIGVIEITGTDAQVDAIGVVVAGGAPVRPSAEALRAAVDQLEAWFAGKLRAFDLPLRLLTSPRWEALRTAMAGIPYGETLSYGALATVAGSSARAIGQACARNPYPIVIPCHRVLATGGLGHYSAGEGIATKRWLLEHERRYAGGAMPTLL